VSQPRPVSSPRAPALTDRIEVRLGLGLWTVMALAAIGSGAGTTFAPYAVPVLLLVVLWPFVRRWKGAGCVLDWLPLPLVVYTYETLATVVPACWQWTIDPWLADADRALLGAPAGAHLEPLVGPTLTGAMSAFYGGYYVVPIVLATWFGLRDRAAFRELVVGVVGLLFVGYLGYLFLPAIGPYAFHPEAFSVPLRGDFVGEGIAALIADRGAGFPRDAFPSLHTANAVTVLLVTFRHDRRAFAVCIVPMLGLIAATVYLRFHYLVDVAAGAALAIAWQALLPHLLASEDAQDAPATG